MSWLMSSYAHFLSVSVLKLKFNSDAMRRPRRKWLTEDECSEGLATVLR
jgi:hypothetical protein